MAMHLFVSGGRAHRVRCSTLVLLLWMIPLIFAQPKTEPPRFEVTSIKILSNPSPNWQSPLCKGNRFLSQTTPVKFIAQWAHDARAFQFTGKWPPWTEAPQYRIEATAAGPLSQEGCKAMVRTMLADEFKLSLRREERAVEAFELVLASKKAALRQINTAGVDNDEADKDQKNWALLCDDGTNRGCLHAYGNDDGELMPGMTMEGVALMLSARSGRPVVDHTGLTGRYAFTVRYDSRSNGIGDDLISAFDHQLGLKLVPKHEPFEIFEFVRVERPQLK